MSYSQKLSKPIRDDPPCKGCTERFTACSDHCPKDKRGEFGYKAWRAEIDKVNKNRKAYGNLSRRYKFKWEAE